MSSVLFGTLSPARRFRNRAAVGLIWVSVGVAAIPLAFLVTSTYGHAAIAKQIHAPLGY